MVQWSTAFFHQTMNENKIDYGHGMHLDHCWSKNHSIPDVTRLCPACWTPVPCRHQLGSKSTLLTAKTSNDGTRECHFPPHSDVAVSQGQPAEVNCHDILWESCEVSQRKAWGTEVSYFVSKLDYAF